MMGSLSEYLSYIEFLVQWGVIICVSAVTLCWAFGFPRDVVEELLLDSGDDND